MENTYTDAQSLWPLVNESLNCSGILDTPIVANTTGTRVCGLQNNRTVVERCCGSAAIQEYQCWLYCESQASMSDWINCTKEQVPGATYGEFCQDDLMSNNTETLASFAYRSHTPRVTWLIMAMLFAFFFVGPTQATTLPSFENELAKRQSSSNGCTLNIDRNFTALDHGSKKVSPTYDCTNTAGEYCSFDLQVQTPVDGNNRTFNGSSAAESRFDDFFDVISNATMRKFPAMSSTNLTRGVAVARGQMFFLGWTPISWCINGTVMGCSSILEGTTDGSYFRACGPTYVDNGNADSSIQGLLNPVYTG